jgi:DNA-binding MarR family transcriptional regulator
VLLANNPIARAKTPARSTSVPRRARVESPATAANAGAAAVVPSGDSFDHIDGSLQYYVTILANRTSLHVAKSYRTKYGLSVAEWRVVATLAEFQPLSAKDISERTVMDAFRISRAISQLEKTGLVVRRIDATDKRKITLNLTAKGTSLHGKIFPGVVGSFRELYSVLNSAEAKVFEKMIVKLERRSFELFGAVPNPGKGAE